MPITWSVKLVFHWRQLALAIVSPVITVTARLTCCILRSLGVKLRLALKLPGNSILLRFLVSFSNMYQDRKFF